MFGLGHDRVSAFEEPLFDQLFCRRSQRVPVAFWRLSNPTKQVVLGGQIVSHAVFPRVALDAVVVQKLHFDPRVNDPYVAGPRRNTVKCKHGEVRVADWRTFFIVCMGLPCTAHDVELCRYDGKRRDSGRLVPLVRSKRTRCSVTTAMKGGLPLNGARACKSLVNSHHRWVCGGAQGGVATVAGCTTTRMTRGSNIEAQALALGKPTHTRRHARTAQHGQRKSPLPAAPRVDKISLLVPVNQFGGSLPAPAAPRHKRRLVQQRQNCRLVQLATTGELRSWVGAEKGVVPKLPKLACAVARSRCCRLLLSCRSLGLGCCCCVLASIGLCGCP
eukprot:m.114860 g.114860  ORF g.114860 m.114860 type:complete len:331 (-) comp16316_c0_seq1:51-1043(-)